MSTVETFGLYMGMVTLGVGFESLLMFIYEKFFRHTVKEYHFSYWRYGLLLLFPIVASVIAINVEGEPALYSFLGFSIVGMLLEWLIGFSYENIVGKRLWTYHRLALNGYTSLLAIPLWGFAGIMCLLLVRIFNW